MPHRCPIALVYLLLLAACQQRPQPQLHTLIITPYTKDREPLTGSITLWQYDQQNFLLPEAIIDCDPEAFDQELEDPEAQPIPHYEIRLAPGHYRIIAHDADQQCEYRQELQITPQSPKWIYVDVGPDCSFQVHIYLTPAKT